MAAAAATLPVDPVPDPVRARRGTRERSGNAMGRARTGILHGARRALAESGPRGLTMVAVADLGGVAKATVYNHFRDRDELVAGLVEDDLAHLLDAGLGAGGLADALARVATAAAALPELRGAVAHSPAAAAALSVPAGGASWDAARAGVATVLTHHGGRSDPSAVDVVLKWVAVTAVAGTDPGRVSAEASLLVGALAAADSTR